MSYNCFFDHLPVELLHQLFNYFSTTETIHTFSDVSDYVKKASWSFFAYTLDFKSIGKSDFDSICHQIRPDQIMSLTLSDGVDTPNQSQLFLSRFPIEQFKRLQSLTLFQIEKTSLESISTDLHQLDQLRSLSLNVESLSHFQSQLVNSSLINLKLGKCSINELENILQHLINLQSLNVCLDVNRSKFILNLPCKQLFRLNIKIQNYRITMNEIKEMLMKLSNLKHFEIQTAGSTDLLNGHEWKILMGSFNTFNFHFCVKDIRVEEILKPFLTPFWLEEKHWFVAFQNNSLFSIPRFAPSVIDISQSLCIQSTASDSKYLYDNVKKIVVTKTVVKNRHYFSKIDGLELKSSVSLEAISSLMTIRQIKCLSILSLDDLIKLVSSIRTMSCLCELSIKQNVADDLIEQMSAYQFERISKLGINIQAVEIDYVIETLFYSFPRVQSLIMKAPIKSKDIIILVIDGFKHLLNVSFLNNYSFYRDEYNFDPNLVARYSERLTKSSYTCAVDGQNMTSFIRNPVSIRYWIEEKAVSRLPLIDWLPYRRFHWYRIKYLLSRTFHNYLEQILDVLLFLIIVVPIAVMLIKFFFKEFIGFVFGLF